jgi:hypothetical protein
VSKPFRRASSKPWASPCGWAVSLSPLDRSGATKVAIVNESLAHEFFGAGSPIGKHVGLGGVPDLEIVGVIADSKDNGIRDGIPNTVDVPVGQSQTLSTPRTLHVYTAADAAKSTRQLATRDANAGGFARNPATM